MHAVRIMVGLLFLVPLAAQARSEYSDCLKAQQQLPPGMLQIRHTPAYSIVIPSASYAASFGDGWYFSSRGRSTVVSSASADAHADRVSAMARNCRQFRKTTPPNFRVVTIKSHYLNPAASSASK